MGGVFGILSCNAIGGDAGVFDVQFTSETKEKYGRENSPPFEQASKLLKSQSSGDRGLSKGQERAGIEPGPADPQQQSRFFPWRRRPSHRRIASLCLQNGCSAVTASSSAAPNGAQREATAQGGSETPEAGDRSRRLKILADTSARDGKPIAADTHTRGGM